MDSPFRCAALVFSLACAASGWAQPSVQDFTNLAPADVRPGRIAMDGKVLIGAVDGSWIKFKTASEWGWFAYRLTRISAEPAAPVPAAPPARPRAVARSGELAWSAINPDGSEPRFWLDGEITEVRAGGAELEGRFAFRGETVRLRLDLLEHVVHGSNPPPTLRNLSYGPDLAQTMDFYRARSSRPAPVAVYIHGGGWRHGDKVELNQLYHFHEFLDAGISVVTIDYRFCPLENPSATLPAVAVPLHDAARAIQFIRHHAREWGLDRERLGIWGTSAGATTALWLATHPDLAEPSSPDEIARESTRPRCVVAFVPQASLDPRQMRAWVGPQVDFGAYAFGIDDPEGRPASFARFLAARERLLPWIREYSPAALVRREGPPLYLDYRDLSLTPHRPLADYYTHSPRFGIGFCDLAERIGRECHLHYAGHDDPHYRTWQDFLVAKLTD